MKLLDDSLPADTNDFERRGDEKACLPRRTRGSARPSAIGSGRVLGYVDLDHTRYVRWVHVVLAGLGVQRLELLVPL